MHKVFKSIVDSTSIVDGALKRSATQLVNVCGRIKDMGHSSLVNRLMFYPSRGDRSRSWATSGYLEVWLGDNSYSAILGELCDAVSNFSDSVNLLSDASMPPAKIFHKKMKRAVRNQFIQSQGQAILDSGILWMVF